MNSKLQNLKDLLKENPAAAEKAKAIPDGKPEEMKDEMRFREDLGFTSLDFMSFLGELEDTFDIELEETEVTQITTLEEALKLLEELQ